MYNVHCTLCMHNIGILTNQCLSMLKTYLNDKPWNENGERWFLFIISTEDLYAMFNEVIIPVTVDSSW